MKPNVPPNPVENTSKAAYESPLIVELGDLARLTAIGVEASVG
jgi:hypothetical protein